MTVLMDPEKRELWKVALLSGEYTQGQNALRRSDGSFCCLGVLCDLYRKETGKGEWVEDLGNKYFAFCQANTPDEAGELPLTVREWAGITGNRRVRVESTGTTLAWENDRGMTFAEIVELL